MVPPELRIVVIRLYETINAKIKTNEGWSKDIKCNLGVNKGCPLSPTLFCIYINKLEECLEFAGCKGTKLAGVLITLLLYADDIVLLAKSHDDLDKKLQILHDYYSKMGMTINSDKTKVMIIKSKKNTHGSFVYNNQCLEQVSSYKYSGIDFSHHFN